MQEAIEAAFILLGSALMLIAAIGILRMPDLLTRMQATTKAASLGAGLLLLGAAVHLQEAGVTMRVLATVFFVLLTTPISAHLLSRAAYFLGVELWEGSVRDELRGHYDEVSHSLDSEREVTAPAPPAGGRR